MNQNVKETLMKKRVLLSIGLVLAGIIILGSVGLLTTRASGLRAKAPEDVVTSFYDDYLAAFNLGSEARGNPLVTRAYRDSAYLHPEFVKAVDALLVAFESSDRPGGYDPFLLAQDVPQHVTVAEVTTFDETAHVRVTSSFEGHAMLVTLTRENGRWQILAVNPMPADVAANFYTWYIRYEGNPLVDNAYAEHPNLTEGFVARVEASLAAMKAENQGGADPILLAQDVPVEVKTAADALSRTGATVKLDLFWGGNPTPSERIVTLTFDDRLWKIDKIAMVD
jgi:hypothetical protein